MLFVVYAGRMMFFLNDGAFSCQIWEYSLFFRTKWMIKTKENIPNCYSNLWGTEICGSISSFEFERQKNTTGSQEHGFGIGEAIVFGGRKG